MGELEQETETGDGRQETRDERGRKQKSKRKKKRRLTEGHLGEKVVDDMVVGHVVEEEAAHPAEEVAVHRRGRAPLEVPLRLAIVRQLRVRVVKVRDHDEPARSGPHPSPCPRAYRTEGRSGVSCARAQGEGRGDAGRTKGDAGARIKHEYSGSEGSVRVCVAVRGRNTAGSGRGACSPVGNA